MPASEMNVWGKRSQEADVPDPLLVGEVQSKRYKVGSTPTDFELPLARSGTDGYVLTSQANGATAWLPGGGVTDPLVVNTATVTGTLTSNGFTNLNFTRFDDNIDGITASLSNRLIAGSVEAGDVSASTGSFSGALGASSVTTTGNVTALGNLNIQGPAVFNGGLTAGGNVITGGTITGTALSVGTPANRLYTLPTADGANGAVMTTNGTGTLTWATNPPPSNFSRIESVYDPASCFVDTTYQGQDNVVAASNTQLRLQYSPRIWEVTWPTPSTFRLGLSFYNRSQSFDVTVPSTPGQTRYLVSDVCVAIAAQVKSQLEGQDFLCDYVEVNSGVNLTIQTRITLGSKPSPTLGANTVTFDSSLFSPVNSRIGVGTTDLFVVEGSPTLVSRLRGIPYRSWPRLPPAQMWF